MELDSLPVCDSGSPAAGAPKKKPEALKSCLKTPNGSSDPGSSGESVMSAASSVPIGPRKRSSVGMSLQICDTPFAYMLRGMRSVACVTEEHEFFDCDQGFAEVFELDFPELCCGDHDFACSEGRMLAAPLGRTHDLCSRTHDLSSRTHDLCDRTHDLCSRMHDLGSCRLSESVLCRMQVAISQCLKVARHGLKVAQRVLHVLCPDLRAGFCQALRFHSAEDSELYSGERCLFERERSARSPSRRHLLPKLLFLILLVLWGYDGPYGGGCYAFGSVSFGCWNGGCRGWWNNNGFGRSMGAMGSYSPSHGSIGIPSLRCTSYHHGSIGIHQSRCTSYHHGSIGIHQSRCTSYHHGSLGIHSCRSTSYVPGSPFGYYAKRWFEYGASGSGGATNQVCCQTGRRKAFRLCQLIEVGINVGPQISGRAIWYNYHELGCCFFWRSNKSWKAYLGPGMGPIFDSIVERFITARICRFESDANGILRTGGAGMAKIPTRPRKWGPELHKGPNWQCCRAQRRLYSTKLSACPRSRGYSRPNGGWREIFAGVRKIAPIGARMGRSKAHCGGRISYTPILCQRPRCSYAVLTGGKCANGTGSSKHCTLTSDLELADAKHSVMARIGTITLSTGIEVWMLQNFIRSLRGGIDALPKMHEARLLMECINMSRRYKETPQFRLETLSNRLVGEIEEGYSTYVALSNIPAQFTGSFVFQALYGDGQIRLRSSIRPSEPVRPRRQQPILAREGPVPGLEPPSRVVVTTITGPETMSAPDNASETGPQRFIGLPMPPPREVGPLPSQYPGFPPPVEGLSLSEQIGRYFLSEQMRWYTTRGLVVPEWCARHISLLHRKIHELQQSFHIQQTGAPP